MILGKNRAKLVIKLNEYILNKERMFIIIKNISENKLRLMLVAVVLALLISITVISELSKNNVNEVVSTQTDTHKSSTDYNANDEKSQDTTSQAPVVTPVPVEESTQDEYLVKSHNGVMTVFKEGEIITVMRYEVLVDTLPITDKNLINEGVTFSNYKDLIDFLENYE